MKNPINFFIFSFICIFQLIQIQSNPIIGIVTYPFYEEKESLNECYLNLDSVKWLEAAGAEIIPIHCWIEEKDLLSTIKNINGVFIQTGTLTPNLNKNIFNLVKKIIEIVLEEKENNGIDIPLLGSGLGMEIISSIISGSTNNFDLLSSTPIPYILYTEDEVNLNTKLFSLFTKNDIKNINIFPLSFSDRIEALRPGEFNNFRDLDNFFDQTSFGLDSKGKAFLCSFEGKKYSIFGVHFNPDSISFDRNPSFPTPKGIKAVRFSQNLSNFFVEICRKNPNQINKELRKKLEVLNSFEKPIEKRNEKEIYRFIKKENY